MNSIQFGHSIGSRFQLWIRSWFKGGCLALLVFAVVIADAATPKDFWLSPKGRDATGKGTKEDPWIVSSADSFEVRMRAIPEHAVIHLLPGVFETYGYGSPGKKGFGVKSNWTITGAGMEDTIVRLVGCIADSTPQSGIGNIFFTGWGPGAENIVIRDMTLDCNYKGLRSRMNRTDLSIEAVRLSGSNLRVQRVKAINSAGFRSLPGATPETFVISLAARDESNIATNLFVEDCVVNDFVGGQCTAISVLGRGGRYGSSGAFRRNRVVLGRGEEGEFGFSAYGTREFVIEQNVVSGAARGFNWDTPNPGYGVVIRSNTFLKCSGWGLNLGGGRNSIVEDNLIELNSSKAVGVHISAANKIFPGASGWIVRNNTFRVRSGSPTALRFYGGVQVTNCVFEGNRLDTRLKTDPSTRDMKLWRNNVTSGGRAVPTQ